MARVEIEYSDSETTRRGQKYRACITSYDESGNQIDYDDSIEAASFEGMRETILNRLHATF
jgi:hypothetical protein